METSYGSEETSMTIRTPYGGDNTAKVFAIGSYASNAWKSGNPHSGIYETDVARTLDNCNCGYPSCNQGGTAVVYLEE